MCTTKICRKCGEEKSINDYYKHSLGKDGHRNICKKCRNIQNRVPDRKYHNSKKAKEKRKDRSKTKEYKEKTAKYEEKRRFSEKRIKWKTEYNKKYFTNPENKVKINTTKRAYKKERIKTDKVFLLSLRLGSIIRSTLKRKRYNKKSKTVEILGCTYKFFKEYLESKFENWMNWDNYGKYNGKLNFGWDIDHIIPISSVKTEEELIKLFHYTNLQPLCSKVNRHIKKDKF